MVFKEIMENPIFQNICTEFGKFLIKKLDEKIKKKRKSAKV